MELGLDLIYDGTRDHLESTSVDEQRDVDVIAVHGLGAHRDFAWLRKKDASNHLNKDVNWLTDLLPDTLRKGNPSVRARIFCYNYDSKWLGPDLSKERLTNIANNMIDAIDRERREVSGHLDRHLILVGHSFGGLVIEKSVVLASVDGGPYTYLVNAISGIIFLGTPHGGSDAQEIGSIISKAAQAFGYGESGLMMNVKVNSMEIHDLVSNFTAIAVDKHLVEARAVVCFFETRKTNLGRRVNPLVDFKVMVVNEKSATLNCVPSFSLDSDHFKLNKFATEDESNYRHVSSHIYRMAVRPKIEINECEKCVQALFRDLTDPRSDRDSIRNAKKDRIQGSCEWIISEPKYALWLQRGGPQLLWLQGGPGIGKTMLSLYLVEEFTKLSQKSSAVTLAYYFCDAKDERRKTATSILRVLLIQLLRQRPALFKHIKSDFKTMKDALVTDFHALWRILLAMIKDSAAGQVYFLVDALDECEAESRGKLFSELQNLFTTTQPGEQKSIKFLITIRPDWNTNESFPSASSTILGLRIDPGMVNADLQKFIDIRVDEIVDFSNTLKKTTKDMLKKYAGGTFLWVSLVIDDLSRTPFLGVEDKLRDLPGGIYDVYDRILSRIHAAPTEYPRLILRMVAVARRPLSRYELAMALAVSSKRWDGEIPSSDSLDELKDASKVCQPFLYHDEKYDTINLVHQSAYDYLTNDHLKADKQLSHYHVDTHKGNFLMFETCWKFLSADLPEKRKLYSFNLPFDTYANKECISHSRAAREDLFIDFKWGALKDVPRMRDRWLLQEVRDGRQTVVRLLLDNGADHTVEDDEEYTPLHLAAECGHEEVTRLLLQRGAIVSKPTLGGRWNSCVDALPRWVPIRVAFNGGSIYRPPFVDEDYEEPAWKGDGDTPLHLAAREGHSAIVQLLLRKGANVVAVDTNCSTALDIAGNEKVVRLLRWRVALIHSALITAVIGLFLYQLLRTARFMMWILSWSVWQWILLLLCLPVVIGCLLTRKIPIIPLLVGLVVIITGFFSFVSLFISFLSCWIGLYLVLRVLQPVCAIGTVGWKMDIGYIVKMVHNPLPKLLDIKRR